MKNESFIREYMIPKSVCDAVISYYDDGEKYTGEFLQDPNIPYPEPTKRSTEVCIHPDSLKDKRVNLYMKALEKCVQLYLQDFDTLAPPEAYPLIITEPYNIQRYEAGEGYYDWHTEFAPFPPYNERCLVFMTYLNDVPNAGTHFKYFDLTTKAEKGSTIIWPAYWTHFHRGQISQEHQKTIVTGWISMLCKDRYLEATKNNATI